MGEYGFDQFDDQAPQGGWQVHGLGGAESAGNYTVGGANIVDLYNQCRHHRSQGELTLMRLLNEAFQQGRRQEARGHLAAADGSFPGCAAAALGAYRAALN